jgi:hypothetical protein
MTICADARTAARVLAREVVVAHASFSIAWDPTAATNAG